MTERKLTVSFGGQHPANIVDVKQMTWDEFAKWLTAAPPEHADKAARGWYCPVEFSPAYRDSENFIARHALTFDFDHVGADTWDKVLEVWGGLAFATYTTWSHTPEAPRFRVVLPLSRPATYDEFQAVARKVATDLDIELFARESFTPSQMMFAPTRKPAGKFKRHVNVGDWLNVDEVLAEYRDWTDHTTWPHRRDGDGVHKVDQQTRPDEKPGIVGDFCRQFRVADAIKRFELPYVPAATEGRWTYTDGSRPEGAIEYDDGLKFHSHHDTDPARGQCNAFDLVRMHRFSILDTEADRAKSVVERPSYRAMAELAHAQPELRAVTAKADFELLGPLVEQEVVVGTSDVADTVRFLVQEAVEFTSGPPQRWIIKNVLPRAEIVVIYGASGSGKSFLSLDLGAAIKRGVKWRDKRTERGEVLNIVAEGAGGYRQRLRAYAKDTGAALTELPAVIADAPNMRDPKDVAAVAAAIKKWGKNPDVIVIDTLAATMPGANENSGEDMGLMLSHCKFLHKHTGALIVLIHHSGKDESRGARGWSGLKGAVDAEIEVIRNGEYRIARASKQKDAADGEKWPFKLKVVPVGIDADGDEVTSCVIEHTEELPPEGVGRARASGKYEPVVLDVLRRMAVGTSVDLEDLLTGCSTTMAKEGDGKDFRKRNAKRGLDGLLAKRLAFMTDGRVSLHSVMNVDEGAFSIEGRE